MQTSAEPQEKGTIDTPKPAIEAKKNDFMSMFDPNAPSTSNTPTVSDSELSKSKDVAAMRAKAS
ncbi:hypothetical protein V8B55DRAFT_1541856 [Mucor lusitanicus]|uniref:Uncharacterized protein n=1 Tax=Mucor circinelloides f. lusitanicus TaxID=29924 RepID=A0A8H4BCN5_MUCCL|nr:hypothetical protein FB192DRAFT_1438164 [Mucor lusitanicus]